jgi:hypothetical protein
MTWTSISHTTCGLERNLTRILTLLISLTHPLTFNELTSAMYDLGPFGQEQRPANHAALLVATISDGGVRHPARGCNHLMSEIFEHVFRRPSTCAQSACDVISGPNKPLDISKKNARTQIRIAEWNDFSLGLLILPG